VFQPRSKGIEEVEFRNSDFEPRSVLRYLAESALENSDPSESLIEIGSTIGAEGQRQETVLLVSAVELRILSA
jgi:hypothetical protein